MSGDQSGGAADGGSPPSATGTAELPPEVVVVQQMKSLRDRVRAEMGGRAKIAAIHEEGRLTVREHIQGVLDSGSFEEIGTFASFEGPVNTGQVKYLGGGTIGGLGTIDGRPVVVTANDDTVMKGAGASGGKSPRLLAIARRRGLPIVSFGQGAGAALRGGSSGVGLLDPTAFPGPGPMFKAEFNRNREIPVVQLIIGNSFGGPSFFSAVSDLVVQMEGTCLSIVGPRVVEAATGERVSDLDLGGPTVHLEQTGQIDAVASSPGELHAMARQFLSYLPSRAGGPLPTTDLRSDIAGDGSIAMLVPARRQRAYDVRRVIRRLADDGTFCELKERFAPSMVTGLTRIGGVPVGVIANNPLKGAGAITPEGCLKAIKTIVLCDSFGLPLVFLQDTPGFLIGSAAEQAHGIARSIMLMQALEMASVPILAVTLRKAFGLAFLAMATSDHGADFSVAWPGAEIGFMDPTVAASVLYSGEAPDTSEEERASFLADRARQMATDFSPYGVASGVRIDEIIEPASTRPLLAKHLRAFISNPPRDQLRRLANWPYWF